MNIGAKIDHPLFGLVEFLPKSEIGEYGELCTLQNTPFRGAMIPITLYYSEEALTSFSPDMLEPFTALIGRLDEFDAKARTSVSTETRVQWLADRIDASSWATHDLYDASSKRLEQLFPKVTLLTDVSEEQFATALWLEKIGFSLNLPGSDGAALTMDYRILPVELDNHLFAARFEPNGTLIGVRMES